jgi:hypothetical protein
MPQTATPPQAPAARAPQPRYTNLFQEPVYPDGPYDQGDEDDDTEG